MKTKLRSVYTSDEKGVAVFVTLILLFVVTIAGVTILTMAGRDRIATSDMSAVRGTAEAANTALDACENQITQKSPLMIGVLNKYLKDNSYRWFFTNDSLQANKEKKVSLGDGYFYSAEIMAYDTTNNVLQVRGIGYGRSNEQKTVVAQYRLSGLQKAGGGTAIPRYALYLAGKGRNFDIPIEVTGDVYVGKDFHFNSGASNCKIHGFVKSGVDLSLTSGIDGLNLSIDSGLYIGTGLKMNSTDFTCTNRFGIEGNLELDKILTLKKQGWFNGKVTGNGFVNMSNDTIHHSGSVSMMRVIKCKKEDNQKAKIPDIAQKIGVGTTNDQAWGVDTTGLMDIAYGLGKSIDADKLNIMYNKALSEGRTRNGYVVVYDSVKTVELDLSPQEFGGKAIFLLTRGLSVNGKFFNMTADSRVLIIAMDDAVVNGFGGSDSRTFNGLVYLMESASMKTQAFGTYTINGAIHLAGVDCPWQMNNVEPKWNQRIIFNYNPLIISEFTSMGIIIIPAPAGGSVPSVAGGTFRLTDFKIRQELLSVSY